jgi:SAM-dependent methyltransferase
MTTGWSERLREMERWYNDFLEADPLYSEVELLDSYEPYCELLQALRGRILDVGGGAGLAARFLNKSCEYWVIDPSAVWSEPQWLEFGQKFRKTGPEPRFVMGTGENLPFESARFDHVLAFWSLNHASVPAACISEISRVVKTEGNVLLVLEDMEPTWSDLFSLAKSRIAFRLGRWERYPVSWHQAEIETVSQTVRYKLSGKPWPLERDHNRILESDLLAAASGHFEVLDRSWAGGFLSFLLRRLRKGSTI